MKRIIPIVILLAVAVAAGVYYYPRLTKKTAPVTSSRSPATLKRMRAWWASRCRGASSSCRSRRVSRWRRMRCWRGSTTPIYKQRVRIDEAAVRVRESNLALTLGRNTPSGSEGGAADDDRCRG